MATRKTQSTKSAEPMKQAKLSFTSKRTSSATAAKSSASGTKRKQPARAASSPDLNTIVISDSDSESDIELHEETPQTKRRRVGAPARVVESVLKPEPEPEREQLDVSDKRWRKLYGEVREKMGNLDPVHAKGQTMVTHILRVFDLTDEYGPCVGVSRLERWERAEALGLHPPVEIKQILTTKEGSSDELYTQSVFHGEV